MRPVHVLLCCASLTTAATARAQTTLCANLRPDGFVSTGTLVASASLSADGRAVAFEATATDLVAGAQLLQAIYARDLATGAIVLVSRDAGGAFGIGRGPSISADGRHVAFSSADASLVAGDTNGVSDAFVHDLQTGTTTRVSQSSSGAQATTECVATSISADGRFVVFHTRSAMEATDTNGMFDVYVRDVQLATTWRASVATGGGQSQLGCQAGSISADGNRVVFVADGDDVGMFDSNTFADACLRDRALGTTQVVSLASSGFQATVIARRPVISGNGQVVVFGSTSNSLVPVPPPFGVHLYARDLTVNTTELVDLATSSTPANGSVHTYVEAYEPWSVSHDGRFVAFVTSATNLAADDTNGDDDVYLRDRVAQTTVRAGLGAAGQQQDDGGSRGASVSDDGLRVAFVSWSENLIAGDPGIDSGRPDVFVRDLTLPPAAAVLCAGSAGGVTCPCANQGRDNRGCGHSEDPFGAGFVASGEARVSADTLRLGGYELPTSNAAPNVCLFFQGTTSTLSSVAVGDGVRCIGGTLNRLATKPLDTDEEAHYPGLGDASISTVGVVPPAGATRYYQLWYRDTATYCTPGEFNVTNALRVVWAP